MTACKYCGLEIHFVYDWRGRAIIIEMNPRRSTPISYFEPTLYMFQEIYRHDCDKRPLFRSRKRPNRP